MRAFSRALQVVRGSYGEGGVWYPMHAGPCSQCNTQILQLSGQLPTKSQTLQAAKRIMHVSVGSCLRCFRSLAVQSVGQRHPGPDVSRQLRPTCARLCTGTNPHDVFNMSLHLDAKDPMVEAKTQALRKRGLGAHTIFPLRMSGLPNSILQMAAFIEAQPESPEEVEELAGYLLDKVWPAA